jgi:hypothetical protein
MWQQWSLYVPPDITFNYSTFCPHSVFVCFVLISEQKTIISLYSIKWLVCIAKTECVYCAVRTGPLTVTEAQLGLNFSNTPRSAYWKECGVHFVINFVLSIRSAIGNTSRTNYISTYSDTCILRIYSASHDLLARRNLRSGFKHRRIFCGR